MFDVNKLYSMVNADSARCGTYGYFANNLQDLKEVLNNKKVKLHVQYTYLQLVLSEKWEKRFDTKQGVFALFYPCEKDILDK